VGHHRLGEQAVLMRASSNQMRDMQGYIGSIAFAENGRTIAATSPRGGKVQYFSAITASTSDTQTIPDVCGIAATPGGFLLTSGTGMLLSLGGSFPERSRVAQMHWDNHLIPI
ncbi:DUF1513 domain-containing protein, partial [Sulfitobacter mediterraneus]